ncbi:MAG: 50S ribosomal protein L4 [Geminicoccaceae bacterium]|nr:MAG: 50S ribosomal protein L4 [Geminicoccaceae bacterium]
MELPVISLTSETTGSVDVDDAIFGVEPRADILHRMVVYQLAKRRAGTHKVKNRGEITRTGAKMYKQKGTGRARHSSARVSQFRGGGRAFGPTPRDHAIDLPKRVRRMALVHALASKARSGQLFVLDEAALPEPKTKPLAQRLEQLAFKSAFVVGGNELDGNLKLASRNLPRVDVVPTAGINVYDILRADVLLVAKDSLESLQERLK